MTTDTPRSSGTCRKSIFKKNYVIYEVPQQDSTEVNKKRKCQFKKIIRNFKVFLIVIATAHKFQIYQRRHNVLDNPWPQDHEAISDLSQTFSQ